MTFRISIMIKATWGLTTLVERLLCREEFHSLKSSNRLITRKSSDFYWWLAIFGIFSALILCPPWNPGDATLCGCWTGRGTCCLTKEGAAEKACRLQAQSIWALITSPPHHLHNCMTRENFKIPVCEWEDAAHIIAWATMSGVDQTFSLWIFL